MLGAIVLAGSLLCSCGGSSTGQGCIRCRNRRPTPPAIAATPALNGAVVVSLSATPGAAVYYTVDGSTPTAQSQIYEAPFLVASNLTVKAISTTGHWGTKRRQFPGVLAQHSFRNARLVRRVRERFGQQCATQSASLDL